MDDASKTQESEELTDDDIFESAVFAKERKRSFSGGTQRVAAPSLSGIHEYRIRRQSGDDVLSSVSPARKAVLFDSFRPRSKSDSKHKRPNIIGTLRNSMQHTFMPSLKSPPENPSTSHASTSGSHHPDGRTRYPSGPVSKVIDMIRGRSHSITPDTRVKKAGASAVQSGALQRRYSVDPENRRRIGYQKSLDILDQHTLLIHKDARVLPTSDSICDKIDIEELGDDENLLFVKFFKYYKCYDLIPVSAKLVVFDTQLLVKKAFYALVQNGVRAAPLWDCTKQQFVGMLTITDFINILWTYYKSPNVRMEELEEHKIETWRNVLKEKARPLVSISPDESLFDAIKTLIHCKVHRLPVIDPVTGNCLYIITHKRILKFLFLYFYDLPQPSYLQKTIRELQIGTIEDVATAKPTTPLITAMSDFIERRVSALPVVDDDGKVVDLYAKFDVINLAADKTYNNLEIPIKKALEHRDQWLERVVKCTLDDTLGTVMEKIVQAEVHRLVIVDGEDKVLGILALSDILAYLVLKPVDMENPESPNEEGCIKEEFITEEEIIKEEELVHKEDIEEEDEEEEDVPHNEDDKEQEIIKIDEMAEEAADASTGEIES